MKLLYAPFSLLAALLGARIGRNAFTSVWGRVAESPAPPSPKSGRHHLAHVAGAAALEAGMMAFGAAIMQQLTARVFHHLFGVWPEKSRKAEH
jgi:hypothetical protein